MRVKWTSLRTIVLVIVTTAIIKKCDFAATSRTSEVDIIYDPECNLSTKTEAYCVPIHNCITILYIMNHSAVRARECGPRNENVKRPYVCCEKKLIELEASLSTTTQKILTSTLSDQELQFSNVEDSKTEDEFFFAPTQKPQTPQGAPAENTFDEDCGIQHLDSRIVGGEPGSKKEFPWLARLLRRDSQGDMIFSCSGALLSSKVVLTAAHCLASDSLIAVGDLHAVSLGEHETTCDADANECLLNKRTVVVSGSVVHPQYNKNSRNHDNDIGLVFLRDKVKYTHYIVPICLLQNSEEGFQYYVAGWGRTETGSVSGVKRKIAIQPFAWDQCAKRYNITKLQLTPRQICAGGSGMDACQGDSGGPLMVQNRMKWYAAGIVSLGLGCGRKGWPGIYTYVPNYVNWIKETVRDRGL